MGPPGSTQPPAIAGTFVGQTSDQSFPARDHSRPPHGSDGRESQPPYSDLFSDSDERLKDSDSPVSSKKRKIDGLIDSEDASQDCSKAPRMGNRNRRLSSSSIDENGNNVGSRGQVGIHERFPDASRKLFDAVIRGNAAAVFAALESKGALASCVDNEGRNLLIHACLHDQIKVVRALRAFEVDVNLADKKGITPLHAACMRSRDPELLKLLVRQGASVDAVTHKGLTILHAAAKAENIVGIRFALSQGVDVNAGGISSGLTPLHFAFAFCKSEEIFNCLIDAGASDSVIRPNGDTLLHVAVWHDNWVGTKVALEKGLKVETRNNEGDNALAVAKKIRRGKRCSGEVLDLLKNAGRKELHDCSFCENKATILFKPCLHRVSCCSCYLQWSKCVCGVVIEEASDVLADPRAFDEALKSGGNFIREVETTAFLKEKIDALRIFQDSNRAMIASFDGERARYEEGKAKDAEELKRKGELIETLRGEVAEERARASKAEDSLNTKEINLTLTTDLLENCQKDKEELKKCHEGLGKRNDELEKANEKLGKATNFLKSANADLRKANNLLVKEKGKLLKEREEFMKEKVQQLLKEKEELVKANQDLAVKFLKGREEFVKEKRYTEELGKTREKLGKANEKLGKANRELVKANQDLRKANQDFVKANKDFEKANKGFYRSNKDLGKANDELIKEKAKLVKERDELMKAKGQLMKEKEELVKERDELKKAKGQLMKEKEEFESGKEELIKEKTCDVCLVVPKSFVFTPCGHCACAECQKNLTSCHICRTRIGKKMRFF